MRCEKMNVDVTEGKCIVRHEQLNESERMARLYHDCASCQIGIDLYQAFLKPKENKVNQKQTNQNKMKRCGICKDFLPADLKHFERANLAQDGLTKDCLRCRAGDVDPGTIPVKTKVSDPAPVKPEMPQTKIVLDFTNHMDAFEKLKKVADNNLRTPGKQALWIMIEVLEEVD